MVGGNRGNLVFSHGKIFSCHENAIIPCVRWDYFGGNLTPKSIPRI